MGGIGHGWTSRLSYQQGYLAQETACPNELKSVADTMEMRFTAYQEIYSNIWDELMDARDFESPFKNVTDINTLACSMCFALKQQLVQIRSCSRSILISRQICQISARAMSACICMCVHAPIHIYIFYVLHSLVFLCQRRHRVDLKYRSYYYNSSGTHNRRVSPWTNILVRDSFCIWSYVKLVYGYRENHIQSVTRRWATKIQRFRVG